MPAPKKTPAAKTTTTKKATPRKPAVKKPAAKKTPVKRAAAKKAPVKAAPTPTAGFIDKDLMEKAIALRGQGKTMKEIGVELNVKATAYLAKKIKDTFGADALDRPRKEA
jgi:pyruvate/2-oxoglutarate dehydrogenase complex dihydrolipoamide acyltransferase (E2) component